MSGGQRPVRARLDGQRGLYAEDIFVQARSADSVGGLELAAVAHGRVQHALDGERRQRGAAQDAPQQPILTLIPLLQQPVLPLRPVLVLLARVRQCRVEQQAHEDAAGSPHVDGRAICAPRRRKSESRLRVGGACRPPRTLYEWWAGVRSVRGRAALVAELLGRREDGRAHRVGHGARLVLSP